MINKIFNIFCALLIIAVPLAAVKAKSQASHISYEDTVVFIFLQENTQRLLQITFPKN